MHRLPHRLGFLAFIALLSSAPASSRVAEPTPGARAPAAPAPLRPLQSDCSERMGPFVTQDTAWARLHEAESQGYGVSGVFPCYDGDTRGYCFNVFYPC
jgi:hypothetical protein